jgi:hypothetical protein
LCDLPSRAVGTALTVGGGLWGRSDALSNAQREANARNCVLSSAITCSLWGKSDQLPCALSRLSFGIPRSLVEHWTRHRPATSPKSHDTVEDGANSRGALGKVGGTDLAAPAPNAHLELGPMPVRLPGNSYRHRSAGHMDATADDARSMTSVYRASRESSLYPDPRQRPPSRRGRSLARARIDPARCSWRQAGAAALNGHPPERKAKRSSRGSFHQPCRGRGLRRAQCGTPGRSQAASRTRRPLRQRKR